MARTILDDLWLCLDCTVYAVNGEGERPVSGPVLTDSEINGLAPDFDSNTGDGITEFSWSLCACCGSSLGGEPSSFRRAGVEDHLTSPFKEPA